MGTVADREGTQESPFEGRSAGDMNHWRGTWGVVGRKGELVNLHGQGFFWSNGLGGVYNEGQIRFDP